MGPPPLRIRNDLFNGNKRDYDSHDKDESSYNYFAFNVLGFVITRFPRSISPREYFTTPDSNKPGCADNPDPLLEEDSEGKLYGVIQRVTPVFRYSS